jgi:hypothetical protein
MRKKVGMDEQVPALVESAVSSKAFRRNWARLIQKIYQIDPPFFLSLQVCSKSPNTFISSLYARCAQPDRTYSMLYVLSG